jgi:hypothetical protein
MSDAEEQALKMAKLGQQLDGLMDRLSKRSAHTEGRLLVLLQVYDQAARHYDTLRVQVSGLSLAGAGVSAAYVAQRLSSSTSSGAILNVTFDEVIVGFLFFFISMILLIAAVFFQSAYIWNWHRMDWHRKALLKFETLDAFCDRRAQVDQSAKDLKSLSRKIDELLSERGWLRRVLPPGNGEAKIETIWVFLPAGVSIFLLASSLGLLIIKCKGSMLTAGFCFSVLWIIFLIAGCWMDRTAKGGANAESRASSMLAHSAASA